MEIAHDIRRGPEADIALAQTMARWMDRLALDPILGFVLPGAGDLIGSVVGLYTVGIALRHRLPAIVVARMLFNLGVDALIGAVPVIGDLGDFAFRAHQRNAELLVSRRVSHRASWRDWLVILGAGAFLVGALVLATWLTVTVVRALL